MDDSNPDHAMVQGQGYDAGTRFEEPITTNWSDELTDDLTHVETRWKEILVACWHIIGCRLQS